MMNAKEEVRRILEQIPEDVTFEDIQYHIYVQQQIARGLEEIDQGKVVSEEEAERRMSKWLEPITNSSDNTAMMLRTPGFEE